MTSAEIADLRKKNYNATVTHLRLANPDLAILRVRPDAGITPLGSKSFALSAQVHTEAEAGAKGSVRLDLPEGWRSEPASAPFALERAGQEQVVRFEVIAGAEHALASIQLLGRQLLELRCRSFTHPATPRASMTES